MQEDDIAYILNILRRGTIQWPGRALCLRRARKKVFDGKLTKAGKKVWKYFWQCSICKEWYREESMLEVDHIIEVGPYSGDIHLYASKLYCGQDNLQALCQVCHQKKTSNFNASLLFKRKQRIVD